MTTKKGAQYASVLNMLLLLLPGTPTTYQGEEFGMLDTIVSFEESQDPWGKNFGPVSTLSILLLSESVDWKLSILQEKEIIVQ